MTIVYVGLDDIPQHVPQIKEISEHYAQEIAGDLGTCFTIVHINKYQRSPVTQPKYFAYVRVACKEGVVVSDKMAAGNPLYALQLAFHNLQLHIKHLLRWLETYSAQELLAV